MDPLLPPTVCVDGGAARRIREEKKLTQLYVAKVVGVTTDTISRWENNRYPTIKRENALRLAEALEVAVEEILRPEAAGEASPEPEPEQGQEQQRPPRSLLRRAAPFVFALLALVGGYLLLRPPAVPEAGLTAERLLPAFAAPGTVIPVQLRLESGEEPRGFILREHFPQGWQLVEASPPASSLDNEEGTARWIVKPGEQPQLIAYLLRVSERAEPGREGTFSGEIVANPDGRSVPAVVAGASGVRVAPFQWADLNGDNVIDDAEMLQASDTVDRMKGVHLDWNQLEDIWDAGGYRWDDRRSRFVPSRPSPAASFPDGQPR